MSRRRLVNLLGFRTYNPRTHATYEIGKELVVPPGQSVYDPEVFGRYDRATQQVVRRSGFEDGMWTIGFDEMLYDAQLEAVRRPEAVVRDRYDLVLSLLGPGVGICLDACTGSPDPAVRARVEALGYTHVPIDIDGDDNIVRREDIRALSFARGSIAVIISLDTLEHVEEYAQALVEFSRVLEPGGILAVHVPTYFFDRQRSVPLDARKDPWGHVRYFSGRELVEAIRAAGLSPLRVQLHLDYGAMLCVAAKPVGESA